MRRMSPPDCMFVAGFLNVNLDAFAAFLDERNIDGATEAGVIVETLIPDNAVDGMIGSNAVLKCIEDEPDLPGEPAAGMKRELFAAMERADIDFIVECLRATVKLTKKGIAVRVKKMQRGAL